MSAATDGFVRMAQNLWKAMGRALPSLPESTRTVLATPVEDSDLRWALALLLAGWHLSRLNEPGAAEVEALFQEVGGTAVLEQLSSLQGMLPASFTAFLSLSRQATLDAQLAGAGSYFSYGINDLGEISRQALYSWLRSPTFLAVGQALIRRFPAPGAGRPPRTGAKDPSPRPAPSPPTRGERFDRADFRPRLQRESASPGPASARTPVLAKEDVAASHLHGLGWDSTFIAQALSGPGKVRS